MKRYKYKYRIVTFRIDEDLEKILFNIQELTGENTSEIIRKSIIIYNYIINVIHNEEEYINLFF